MYHGCLPAEFVRTTLVSFTKCRTENSSDKNNNRPIALEKSLNFVLLEIIEVYLDTHDHQFGFDMYCCFLLTLKLSFTSTLLANHPKTASANSINETNANT